MKRFVAAALLAIGLAARSGHTAFAYDVQVDAETLFRAYEVRGPATSTTWLRRRFIQDVELRVSETLGVERADGVTPRLRAVVHLRLNQDVGDTCRVTNARCFDATDARMAGTYQALAVDGVLDAMLAYVDVIDLPAGLEARAGRQLWVDPVGFARVDGASMRVAPTDWLALSAVGGLQVRATSVAGTSAFEPNGVLRLDLSPREQLLASYASAPSRTGLLGAAIEVGDETLVRGQASIREVMDEDGLVMRRVGVSLRSSPVPSLHVSSLGVLDAVDLALVLGNVQAHWQVEDVGLRASIDVMRPRFDLGSIWAYFPTAAVEQTELGLNVHASDVSQLGGGLRGRRTRMRGADDHDAGLHAFATTRVAGLEVNADGYAWLGDLGDLWGVDVSMSRWLSSWVQTQVGVSLQRVNDPARVDYDGISAAEWARAVWRMTSQTQASFEITHAYNGLVAHRFTALASLHIEAWR